MSSTTTVPSTIQLRPSRLVGLLAAAIALAAAVTWAVTVLAVDSSTDDVQSAPSAAVTPQQIAAAHAEATAAAGLSDSALDLIDGSVGSAVGGAGAFTPRRGLRYSPLRYPPQWPVSTQAPPSSPRRGDQRTRSDGPVNAGPGRSAAGATAGQRPMAVRIGP